VIDMLESYNDQCSASSRPESDDLLPLTHVSKAMEHVGAMDYILYAWFPEVLVTRVSLLSF